MPAAEAMRAAITGLNWNATTADLAGHDSLAYTAAAGIGWREGVPYIARPLEAINDCAIGGVERVIGNWK